MTANAFSIKASPAQIQASWVPMVAIALAHVVISFARELDAAGIPAIAGTLLAGLLSAAVFSRTAANPMLHSEGPAASPHDRLETMIPAGRTRPGSRLDRSEVARW
jgi:hypothetical protein